jgi:hypothetical protein
MLGVGSGRIEMRSWIGWWQVELVGAIAANVAEILEL